MGHVHIDITIKGKEGELVLNDVLVDTGATRTVLPEESLKRVGAWKLPEKRSLRLGDGRVVEACSYAAIVRIGDREGDDIVATFDSAEPVVGVLTLESLGLRVDPTTGKLEPTRPKGIAYFYRG